MCVLFCVRSKNDKLFELWNRFCCDEENYSIKKENDQIDEKNNQNCFFDSRNFSFREFRCCDWILEFCDIWCFEAFRLFFRWFQQTTNSFDFRRFFSFSFHKDDSTFLIAFLFFELIRINRNLARFKKKMYSNVSAFAKKIVKIAKSVIQLSIVFDDLRKAMKMLKNRLLTMKKLIKNERMMTLFSEINSEKKAFVSFAEIADERIITIESDHENQKDKFFNRSRKINRID